MISHNRLVRAWFCAVVFTAAAAAASAQVTFTNPPCPTVTLANLTACTVTLNFVPAPPGWPAPVVLAPGGGAILPVAVTPLTINGINTLGGFFHRFNPPAPPPGVACSLNEWWISNVTVAPGCCVDICVNPVTCKITVSPTGTVPPPPCNP